MTTSKHLAILAILSFTTSASAAQYVCVANCTLEKLQADQEMSYHTERLTILGQDKSKAMQKMDKNCQEKMEESAQNDGGNPYVINGYYLTVKINGKVAIATEENACDEN